jgi:phage-related protein
VALSSEFIKAAGLMGSIKNMQANVKKDLPNLVAFGNNVDGLEGIDGDLKKSADELSKAIEKYSEFYQKYAEFVKLIEASHATYDKAVKAYIKDGRNHGEKEYATACEAMEQGLERIEKKVNAMKKYWAPPPRW